MTKAGRLRVDDSCFVCGDEVDEASHMVLVVGRFHRPHCSESCVRRTIRKHRLVRAKARRRMMLGTLAVAAVSAGTFTVWQRHRAPQPEWISSGAPEAIPELTPDGPPVFGPAWPPTNGDWEYAFDRASWIFPLPGPVRRASTADGRIFGPPPPAHTRAYCRKEGRCAADLGGELWGEHVYAALDGVVDRVQSGGTDERGGQYVRLAHFGGMVFTQYFHLASMPKGIVRGARVKAGEVIGLLGDTGLKGERHHLHFTLSVRPSPHLSEVYWDPRPWMEEWTMRSPPNGTVAGLIPIEKRKEIARRRRPK